MQSHYILKMCAVEEKKEAGASLPFDIGICLAIVWVLSESAGHCWDLHPTSYFTEEGFVRGLGTTKQQWAE